MSFSGRVIALENPAVGKGMHTFKPTHSHTSTTSLGKKLTGEKMFSFGMFLLQGKYQKGSSIPRCPLKGPKKQRSSLEGHRSDTVPYENCPNVRVTPG